MRSSRRQPRAGHGERRRVAERVRALLDDAGGPDELTDAAGPVHPGAGGEGGARRVRPAWLPGEWLDAARPPPPAGPAVVPSARLRWQPDRRAVAAVGLAVLVAALLTAWWVLSARPRDLAVHTSAVGTALAGSGQPGPPAGSSAAGAGPTTHPSGSATAARLVVDVAGKVRRPGVYELAPGARVIDALRAAGGARRGAATTTLNLAAPLHDGEQVVVGVPGAPAAGAGGAGSGSGTGAAGPVDLNTATFEQLQTLPGVGPVLAQRILDWRADHGRFTSVDQLNDVSGIGTVKFAQLRDLVTV